MKQEKPKYRFSLGLTKTCGKKEGKPPPLSCDKIKKGATKWLREHGEPVKKNRMSKEAMRKRREELMELEDRDELV